MRATIEEFRARLLEARRELRRRVVTTDTELATLESHPAGSFDEDAAKEVATTVLSRLEGQEKQELDEVEAALARLETGCFGTCEDCGGPISLARLQAVPWARYCLTCQLRRQA
jgi:DnaK suppressor protein